MEKIFNTIDSKYLKINKTIMINNKPRKIKSGVHQCHECGKLMKIPTAFSLGFDYCGFCSLSNDITLYYNIESFKKRIKEEDQEQAEILQDWENNIFQILRLDLYNYYNIVDEKHNSSYKEALETINNFIMKLKKELNKYKIDSQEYKDGCEFIETYKELKEIVIYNKGSWYKGENI